MHASQLLGERFFEVLAKSPWRLRPPERSRPVSGSSGKGLKEPIPLAAQVFNQDCPFTLITVAMPAWLFGGMGGFDRSNQLYDSNDFVQRVQMMDPGVPVQTWTDVSVAGSDIDDAAYHISRVLRRLDLRYQGREYKDMIKDIREQNDIKRSLGSVIRNKPKPGELSDGVRLVPLSGLRPRGTVECASDPQPGAIDQGLLHEDASGVGDLSNEQLAARFLQHNAKEWLKAAAKWYEVPYLQDAQVSQFLKDPQPPSQLSNPKDDYPPLAKSDPPAPNQSPRNTASCSARWSTIGHSRYDKAPKKPEVTFYTWGRFKLHTIAPYNELPAVKTYTRSACGHDGYFCENVSGRALQAVIKSTDVPLVFNCRDFWEHMKVLQASPSWGHCGVHPANIERLVAHSEMKEFANLLCRKVIAQQAARPSLECLDIGLECNKGRDRSVGLSVLLQHLFGLAGWKVSTVHICQGNWRSNDACKRAAHLMKNPRNPYAACPDCQTSRSYETARKAAKSVDGFAKLLRELQK